MARTINLTLRVWRQQDGQSEGRFETYEARDIDTDMSFLEMLDVLNEDYIRTARAKGMKERGVLVKHALRSALLPIVSVTGLWIASLIGDSVLTEFVFSRPGLGKMLVGSILQRDYTALQSIMLIYAAFVVSVNLLTDLTYGWLDPRIRYD